MYEKFFILGRNERNMIKIYMVIHESILYSFLILMKPEFSRWIFEKSSNIKFHKNLSSGSRVVPYGRTDG
jgi:hypothetical protein